MRLSVIIPVYNEQERLAQTLRAIDVYLKKQEYDYEIIVVNDGSKDKTADIVRKMRPEIKFLRLIDRKENKGKGFTVREGLLRGRGDFRIFTDADNSTTIDHIERMWPELEKGYDIVIGSRDIKGAILDPPQPWHRVMLGNVFNLLVQTTLGLWGIWDTQCGFKCFRAKTLEKILPRCRIDRWAFDPEILAVAKKLGYKISQVPVRWVNSSQSSVKLFGPNSMLMALKEILLIKWGLIREAYD